MVLLSFSVKKDELLAGTKIRTTRLYTPEKYALWQRTLPDGDLFLDGWWKPRTKDKDWLFIRKGADLYRLKFDFINGRIWPLREGWITNAYLPMTYEDAQQWAKEEGFENDREGLIAFFVDHYAPLGNTVFQSIAFPPVKGVD